MGEFNMDDFVDNVKTGAAKAKNEAEKFAKSMTEKTESLMGQVKLQYAVKNVKSKIDEAFLDIGRHIYEEFANEDIEGPLKEKCDHVKELYEELDALNEELTALKNTVVCHECGSFNVRGSKYCNVCGSPININERGN